MADDQGFERMGDTDALMWSIERDPMLRSTITSLLLFDDAIDHDRLADKVERASRAIPRLRQRVVANTFSIAPPRWEMDPNFDLRYHLRFVGCPGEGTLADVLSVAEPEAMSSFDLARPLWQMVLVDGMAHGRSAMVVKFHHTITDGIGGLKLGMHLFDLEPAPSADAGPLPKAPPVLVLSQWQRVIDAWEYEQRRGLELASQLVPAVAGAATRLAFAPSATLRRAGELAGSVGRLLAPATRPLSPIMTGRSLSVDLDTLSVPLADAKAAAKAAGCRINDFFLAAVIGGMRRYHDEHDVVPESLRMGMAVSLRPPPGADGNAAAVPESAGNQFVPLRFVVPIQIDDPAERMRALRALVAGQRAEPGLALVDAVAGLTRRLPRAAHIGVLGGLLRTVDFVASNVPGVQIPLYLAGARLEAHYPFGPRSGAAVNVTLLSYRDGLDIGVNTDPAAIPDHDRFMACLHDGFGEVLKVV